MLRTISLPVVLLLQSRRVLSHLFDQEMFQKAFEPRHWELDGSGMEEIKDWPPFDDPAKTCDGSSDEVIDITFTDATGCFQFKTPGFNTGGYANGLTAPYTCEYKNMFPVKAFGTITILQQGFEFQNVNNNGNCRDRLSVKPVDKTPLTGPNPDPEDNSSASNQVQFCGTISSDKERRFFDSRFLRIILKSTTAINGNGAQLILCFD